ncbi:substrate-binding domain-containing protein [Streptomyces libani]|uniref:Substrate-binding domain-containing protein n=3 Tax=Streptomyces nigrescens TaxID=1920 RepID=A0ABY7IA96_STRNI|nr:MULTISPECIES: substrate-binding domain-containing protein [Streptomyces]WAT95352.1 substrate-binding domain-containing protein [Streptomyces libani subsp. libani]WAU02973.1 substrate-binding domain-containing protein [Streptomyces nigrescens]WDT59040.1 substrate-binding domain-containing protein [Streptomyces sp. G7(2002)]
MNAIMRRALTGAVALSLAAPLAACGSDQKDAGAGKDSIGLLLPESKAARYEKFDRRIISSRIASLCLECKVEYHNAEQQVDAQRRQFDALVKKGVKVIILDPVDAAASKSWVDSAAKKGVKVVAYDRLAEGDVAAYVSYDNEKIGRLQAQGILAALGSQAAASDVVMMNGSPTDPNAPAYKKGAHEVLDGKVRKIVYEKDIPNWSAATAKKEMTDVINAQGAEGFDAVYSANDGMAGGIAAALKSAGIKDVPVGGQDAELPALQRLVAGTQYFTIYKEVRPEAETAAEIAFRLLRGKSIKSLTTTTADSKSKSGIPAELFKAQIVTKKNMKNTVVRDGAVRTDLLCEDLADACKSVGLE